MSYTPFDAIQIGIASPEMILHFRTHEGLGMPLRQV